MSLPARPPIPSSPDQPPAPPATQRAAIVTVPHTDTLEILGVEDIVLVTWTTAGLGLAGGALFLGTGARVCLWIDDCKVTIAAL